jgi:DNA (cytosine-5)-methyltransferase 1
MNTNRELFDLFCGIGGLSLGVARADFRLALSVDNDPTLMGMHQKNFPGCNHLNANIADLDAQALLNAAGVAPGNLAGLVGGPPCQGFSHLGKRNRTDARNSLFAHFFRLVGETRPSFYVAENVLGVLDPHNGPLVRRALSHVPDEYTQLKPFVLNASDFGAATFRKRVLFIGFDPSQMQSFDASSFEQERWLQRVNVGTALIGLPRRIDESWTTDERGWARLRTRKVGRFWEKAYGDIPNGIGDAHTVARFARGEVSGCIATLHTPEVVRRFMRLTPGRADSTSRAIRLKRLGLSPTLRAGTGQDRGSFQALRPIHFSEPRVITPREAARIQGFPDWFRFDVTKWHTFRGIGNSVSPLMAESVMRVIRAKLRYPAGSDKVVYAPTLAPSCGK